LMCRPLESHLADSQRRYRRLEVRKKVRKEQKAMQ